MKLLYDHEVEYVRDNGANTRIRAAVVTETGVKVMSSPQTFLVTPDSANESNLPTVDEQHIVYWDL